MTTDLTTQKLSTDARIIFFVETAPAIMVSALTEARNTPEIAAGGVHYTREFTVAGGSTVYAGAITAVNSSGYAVPATSSGSITERMHQKDIESEQARERLAAIEGRQSECDSAAAVIRANIESTREAAARLDEEIPELGLSDSLLVAVSCSLVCWKQPGLGSAM